MRETLETLDTLDSSRGGSVEADPYVELLFLSLDFQTRLRADIEKAGRPLELTSDEALAILFLRERPSAVSDLALAVGLTHTSASSLVARIEGRDLVRPTRRGGDKRVVLVSLTDTGRAVASELRESIDPAGRASSRQLTELRALLRRLSQGNLYSK